MASPLDDARALALAPAPEVEGFAVAEAPGRLGALCAWLAAHPGADADRPDARLRRPIFCLYASASADAGTDAAARARAAMDAAADPRSTLSRLARASAAGVEMFDLALRRPAPDGALRAAMSERECAATIAFGMEALAKTPDLLMLGDVAPGSAVRAARLGAALLGDQGAGPWGAEDAGRDAAVARARAEAGDDPLELLRQLGGREIAAMVGAILAARAQATPVVLDGEGAHAAAAVVRALDPDALAHCLPAGSPDEVVRRLEARPAPAAGAVAPVTCGLSAGEGAAMATLAVLKLAAELNAAAAAG